MLVDILRCTHCTINELLRVYSRTDVHVQSQTSLSSAMTSTDVCMLTTLVSFTSAYSIDSYKLASNTLQLY